MLYSVIHVCGIHTDATYIHAIHIVHTVHTYIHTYRTNIATHIHQEGGVRVPAIWQWPGHIPPNSYTTYWGAHTDIIPTFLDAAMIPYPLEAVPGENTHTYTYIHTYMYIIHPLYNDYIHT